MKKEENILSLKIAATFIGTMVGAGFASGQEILKFFTIYGFDGYIGIGITLILGIVLGIIIFNISHQLKKKSYSDFLFYVCGPKLGLIVDVLITVFLFGTFNVMLSATGALFSEYFRMPYYFGILITIIPSAIIVIRGIKGIIDVNSIVAPIMIISVMFISATSLLMHSNGDIIRNLYYEDDNTYKWLMSSLLYVSYNLVLSIPILVPLSKTTSNKNVLFKGITIGVITIGILIFLLNSVLLSKLNYASVYQIPMLYIVLPFSDAIKHMFITVLWLEIFTTVISNLFGLINRLESVIPMNNKIITLAVCTASIFISRLDFKTLLHILYPVFGMISMLFFVYLLFKQIYLKLRKIDKSYVGKVYKSNSAKL